MWYFQNALTCKSRHFHPLKLRSSSPHRTNNKTYHTLTHHTRQKTTKIDKKTQKHPNLFCLTTHTEQNNWVATNSRRQIRKKNTTLRQIHYEVISTRTIRDSTPLHADTHRHTQTHPTANTRNCIHPVRSCTQLQTRHATTHDYTQLNANHITTRQPRNGTRQPQRHTQLHTDTHNNRQTHTTARSYPQRRNHTLTTRLHTDTNTHNHTRQPRNYMRQPHNHTEIYTAGRSRTKLHSHAATRRHTLTTPNYTRLLQ